MYSSPIYELPYHNKISSSILPGTPFSWRTPLKEMQYTVYSNNTFIIYKRKAREEKEKPKKKQKTGLAGLPKQKPALPKTEKPKTVILEKPKTPPVTPTKKRKY